MKVLLAVDEPNFAKAITDFVVGHKWEENVEFIIMSIVEPLKVASMMAFLPGPYLDESTAKHKELQESIVEATAGAIKKAFPESTVTRIVCEGLASDELMKEITITKPDVLVIGSHGKHGIQRVLLGSVSMFMVSHAPCSVVVVRTDIIEKGEQEERTEKDPKERTTKAVA